MQKLYDQLMSLEGVIEVEILDDWQGKAVVYVCGVPPALSVKSYQETRIGGHTYWVTPKLLFTVLQSVFTETNRLSELSLRNCSDRSLSNERIL